MRILFSLCLLLLLAHPASSQVKISRPDTPYWKIVAEMESLGYTPFKHFDWSDENLEQMARTIPTLNKIRNEIVHRNVQYKAGGDNDGYNGFTTELKNKDIYVQIYYKKPSNYIDVALVLGHELIHATHIDNGLFNEWMKDVSVNPENYASCMSEIGAYTWSGIYASDERSREFNNEKIQEYTSCFVSIRNLPLNR